MTYVDPELIADDTLVAEAVLAGIADRIEGWEAQEGHAETSLSESWATALSTAMTEMKAEARGAFAAMAELVLGIDRKPASYAAATSAWDREPGVMGDLEIPADTEVSATGANGDEVVFRVEVDTVMPAGIATITVPLVAVDPGEEANGAVGEAFQDELPDFAAVTIAVPASGGDDEESLDEYVAKARDRATRLRLIPITPEDHAALALDVLGVDRAFAVNRHNPAAPGTPANGYATIFAMSGGAALQAGTAAALLAVFTNVDRPLAVQYAVRSPNFVDVTIAITVTREPDKDPTALAAEVEAAIRAGINPATWDLDEDRPGRWAEQPTGSLSSYRVAALVDDLPGLRQVSSVTLNGTANGSVTLPAPLSVPRILDNPDGVVVTVV